MNRKALVLLSSLRTLVRGVAISALRRADTLEKFNLADTCVLTFDYCEDYPTIKKVLHGFGYLQDYSFFNLFDYFASRESEVGKTFSESSIALLLRHGKDVKKEPCGKWCFKYTFPDGKKVFEYIKRNSNSVYMRAVSLGEHFLWDYTPEIELIDNNLVVKRFNGSRELWAYFIEEVSGDAKAVHIFQDASYTEKGDTRDKFCAIKRGARFYNYRIAHGATQVNIRKKDSAPIPSWGVNDEFRSQYDGIVFLTNNQRDHWVASQGADHRLVVIPHESGVEDKELIQRDGDRCVCITSLTALKNVDMAIKAFAFVVKEVPTATLEIYGQGPAQNDLEKLIVSLALENNVFLKGYSINAQKALAGAAVSLVTSERESFGMPIVESYAFSCPVVVFDVNYGPHELVDDGVTGFKIKFGEINSFSDAIIKVLAKNDFAENLRSQSYLRSKDFSKRNLSALWNNLMDQSESSSRDR